MDIIWIKDFILPRLEILKRKILGNAYIYKISNGVLDIFFPKICLNCQREGEYLCQDCLAVLDVLEFHQKKSTKNLTDLYLALSYQNVLVKKLIQKFKYQPFIKELSKTLADLIIAHFQLLDNVENFSDFILIPVPLGRKRLRWRGFNQAEEVGKHLSFYFKIPLLTNVLIKIKETQPQVELEFQARKEILKGVFFVKPRPFRKNDGDSLAGKKILLVDDVYTTGTTMEECANVLKEAGARKIIGIAIARAEPEK